MRSARTTATFALTLGRVPVTPAAIVLAVGGQFVLAAICLVWAVVLVAWQMGAF